MNRPVFHSWHPIKDLPEDHAVLSSPELPALGRVWEEQRGRLRDAHALHVFLERLQRQRAIETGIIERLYTG